MAEYTIKIDLSDLFDDLRDSDKMAFLLEKFGDLNAIDQKYVLGDMVDTLSNADAADLLKSSFDNLNENAQFDVYNYVNEVMGE